MPLAVQIIIAILSASTLLWIVTTTIVCYNVTFSMKERTEAALKLPSLPKNETNGEALFSTFYKWQMRPYERVEILARDGTRLSARYYHFYDDAPLAICFHGYKSNPLRDCYGMAEILSSEGFNLLLPDQRGHGKSQGRTISFGIRERFDCADWVEYANHRFGSHTGILLGGVSMGGATVLMASSLNLPKNVIGILSDCPFSSPRGIIKKVCRDMGFSPILLYPFVVLGAFLLGGGLRLKKDVSAIHSVQNTSIPVLLVHGEADAFVPCEMSREIQQTAPHLVTLYTFPAAAHTHCYISNPAFYREIVRGFLRDFARRTF